MTDGAQSAINQNIVLAVGEAGHTFVEVKFDEIGNVCMVISEEGRKNVSFADLAGMETKLMQCMLLHGWQKAFNTKDINLYDEEDEESLSEVEKKMLALGVFQLGIDRPKALGDNSTLGKVEPIASKDKALVARDDAPTPQPSQEPGQEIHFGDPFHGRAKSIASDSGFSGMHRVMELRELLKEADELASQARGNSSPLKAPGSSDKGRRSYAKALSTILVDTEVANAPARIRASSSAVPIKSPDGKELDFTKKMKTPAASDTRYGSPERDGRTFDPYTTPRRRSGSSTASSGNVSPRTKTTSPKKSYTIKASPAQVLAPIGTPSRRSLQDNTINIGDTINEEGEDESIMMRGGRSRGSFRGFY